MSDGQLPYGHVLRVNDESYPVVWGDLTARHYGEMELFFGCDPDDVRGWIADDDMTLPRLAYMAWLSERAKGSEPVDPASFLDGMKASASYRIEPLEPPTPSIARDADPEA